MEEFLCEIDMFDKTYHVYKSWHTTERRENQKEARDFLIPNNEYETIMRYIIKNGISEFRNKGKIAVTFNTSDIKNKMSILCILEDDNITIITILCNDRNINDRFHKVKNFIYMRDYTLLDITHEEKVEKDMDKLKEVIFKSEGLKNKKIQSHRKKINIKKKQGKTVVKKINYEEEDKLFLKSMIKSLKVN